jgi:hypothetical protein
LRQRALVALAENVTTINAIPGSGGIGAKNAWSASTPPADAPTPTTGK